MDIYLGLVLRLLLVGIRVIGVGLGLLGLGMGVELGVGGGENLVSVVLGSTSSASINDMLIVAFLHEKLLKMVLAVEDSIQRCIG